MHVIGFRWYRLTYNLNVTYVQSCHVLLCYSHQVMLYYRFTLTEPEDQTWGSLDNKTLQHSGLVGQLQREVCSCKYNSFLFEKHSLLNVTMFKSITYHNEFVTRQVFCQHDLTESPIHVPALTCILFRPDVPVTLTV